MSSRDPLDVLRDANPVPALSAARPGDEALLQSILATPRARRTRKLWVVGGTGVVAVALAAFAVFHQSSPKDPTAVVCYSDAHDPPKEKVGLSMVEDPVAACAEQWNSGVLGSGSVPALTACISNDGTIAVIPGDQQVCSKLGLDNWVGSFSTGEEKLISFTEAVTDYFASKCVAPDDAVSAAQRLLDEWHMAGWSIQNSGGWTSARQCTGSGVDPANKHVIVVSRRRNSTDPSTPTT